MQVVFLAITLLTMKNFLLNNLSCNREEKHIHSENNIHHVVLQEHPLLALLLPSLHLRLRFHICKLLLHKKTPNNCLKNTQAKTIQQSPLHMFFTHGNNINHNPFKLFNNIQVTIAVVVIILQRIP